MMRNIINYDKYPSPPPIPPATIPSQLTYPEGVYNWIFIVCFLHPIHIGLAFRYNMYLCGTMGIILFGTSLNYWRKPYKNSFARYFDMMCVFVIVPYHYYLALFSTNKSITITLMTIGIVCYPISIIINHDLTRYNYVKCSALLHCFIHILVSIGCCFIYYNYYRETNGCEWNINCPYK